MHTLIVFCRNKAISKQEFNGIIFVRINAFYGDQSGGQYKQVLGKLSGKKIHRAFLEFCFYSNGPKSIKISLLSEKNLITEN